MDLLENKQPWYFLVFKAVLENDKLDPDFCLNIYAFLGALILGIAVLDQFIPVPEPDNKEAILQFSLGGIFIIGWILKKQWTSMKENILFVQAMIALVMVIGYVIYMYRITTEYHIAKPEHFRVTHAPGILAIGCAIVLRELVDFGPLKPQVREKIAKLSGVIGLIVGGFMDAFVIYCIHKM